MIEISEQFLWFMIVVSLWSLPWKGYALWLAAGRSEKKWFIALLVLNTLALLEIFYIFFIAKAHKKITVLEEKE